MLWRRHDPFDYSPYPKPRRSILAQAIWIAVIVYGVSIIAMWIWRML